MSMTNTSIVYARIDTGLKEDAEEILSQLGLSPSSAIQMLYTLRSDYPKKGMPFELRLPSEKPAAIGRMTRKQLDTELMKCIESMKSGKNYTADEVDAKLKQEFDI